MSIESGIIKINGVDYIRRSDVKPSPIQIVVAQRGWVFVGNISFDGDDLVISNARNIRQWGTTRGLGELVNGPLSSTKHDDYGTVRMPYLAVIARIDVADGAWT